MENAILSGIRFTYGENNAAQLDWRPGLQLLFSLIDGLELQIQAKHYTLGKADIAVINPYESYRAFEKHKRAEGYILLELGTQLLQTVDEGYRSRTIFCHSCLYGQEAPAAFEQLREAFAGLFMTYSKEGPGYRMRMYSEAYALLHILYRNFSTPVASAALEEDGGGRKRLITEAIAAHYNEGLTLESLAARLYLSSNYLSRFFKTQFGVSFTKYLAEVRLGHAYEAVRGTARPIIQIAADCGFPKSSSLIQAFRARFGLTPAAYRKQLQQPGEQAGSTLMEERSARFQVLLQYSRRETDIKTPAPAPGLLPTPIRLDAAPPGKTLHHTWKQLLNVGYAKEILNTAVKEQIEMAQREIGFSYLRFHGILDDELQVYQEDAQGRPRYSFTLVDLVLDSIHRMGLLPYIEFDYMPTQLAKEQSRAFSHGGIISLPKNNGKWYDLIHAFLAHCVERYGPEEVRRWYFTSLTMNAVMHGYISFQDFVAHYQNSYRAIKSVDPALRIGGPTNEGSLLLGDADDSFQRFLTHCIEADCVPDFITMHAYSHDFTETIDDLIRSMENPGELLPSVLPDDNFVHNIIRQAKRLLRCFGLENRELVLDEWRSTIWQRDRFNDNCYSSAFIAKHILENYDRVDKLGYWTLSDYLGELTLDNKHFHGGYGLVTYSGIPKSGFNAMRLLARLGDHLLERGEGYFITKSQRGYQIALYSFTPYDKLYRKNIRQAAEGQDPYASLQDSEDILYDVTLENAAPGRYRLQSYTINREAGSAYDLWMAMGAPEEMTQEEIDHLRAISPPGYACETQRCEGSLTIRRQVRPNEFTLIVASRLPT